MKKVLVTGAAGFVGSSLVDRLLDSGTVHVVGVDSFSDYYSRAAKERNLLAARDHANFEFIEADLAVADVASLVDSASFVFHQAGQPGVRASWGSDFGQYLVANIDATQRLLEAAVGSTTLERLIYASSSSVYGAAESYPTSETVLPQPRSPYGVTKLAAEHLCGLYAHGHGVPTVSLRYFTVFGPRQRPDMAFRRFCEAVVAGSRIDIYGDGTQVRDFTYVDDVVEANVLCAEGEVDLRPGSVFNVAGGGQTTIREVLRVLAELAGKDLDVSFSETVVGDVLRTAGDGSRFTLATGWLPKVGLVEGLERELEWVADVARPAGG